MFFSFGQTTIIFIHFLGGQNGVFVRMKKVKKSINDVYPITLLSVLHILLAFSEKFQ